MADCADATDAEAALAAGVDGVSTALSDPGGDPAAPNFALIEAMRSLTPHVVAEGLVRTPEQAVEALRRGAWAVAVGSAITGAEHVTGRFAEAIAAARPSPPA
jgi:N-acetylmannosamine-6-phosphate 2-epimerase/N-acetylmannosamine kinase